MNDMYVTHDTFVFRIQLCVQMVKKFLPFIETGKSVIVNAHIASDQNKLTAYSVT
jgi:hypothetical protein